jgi:GT2 family glycosyltransferase
MIYYSIPWNTEKNIGVYYNQMMNMVNDDDYVCFIDADATFTTTFFGKQLEDIVTKYKECGFFTCVTNRVGCVWQLSGSIDSDNIKEHREYGQEIYDKYYDSVTQINDQVNALSGVLILVSKRIWKTIGGFSENGMLGVDNDFYFKALSQNQIIYRMDGVYLYHWYRGGDMSRSLESKKHLLK